jgi:hypothetical protein
MLNPNRVSALLTKLERLGFYRITDQTVQASIEKLTTKTTVTAHGQQAEGERVVITDCDLSTISVRRGPKSHTVTFYAVDETAKEFPKAGDLNVLKKAIDEVYKALGEKS